MPPEKYKIGLRTTCICKKIGKNKSLYIWKYDYRVGERYKCEWVLDFGPKIQVRVYGRTPMSQKHPCYFIEDNFHKYFTLVSEYRNNKINEILS